MRRPPELELLAAGRGSRSAILRHEGTWLLLVIGALFVHERLDEVLGELWLGPGFGLVSLRIRHLLILGNLGLRPMRVPHLLFAPWYVALLDHELLLALLLRAQQKCSRA